MHVSLLRSWRQRTRRSPVCWRTRKGPGNSAAATRQTHSLNLASPATCATHGSCARLIAIPDQKNQTLGICTATCCLSDAAYATPSCGDHCLWPQTIFTETGGCFWSGDPNWTMLMSHSPSGQGLLSAQCSISASAASLAGDAGLMLCWCRRIPPPLPPVRIF